jgi:hypothetical protein
MMLKNHLLISLLFGAIILQILHLFSAEALFIIVLANLFVDLDHAFNYVATRKHNSMKKFVGYQMYSFENQKHDFHIFHTLEFIMLFAYISFFNQYLLIFFIGIVLHMVCDIASHFAHRKSIKEMKKWSCIWHLSKATK